MMGFMMWLAGSTVHLFSIAITFSALWQPISALQSVGKKKDEACFVIYDKRNILLESPGLAKKYILMRDIF
ncbi:hypothetical protein Ahy_A07g032764 isoform A [Arachis hypogaea]|uniref:ER membrane protein complex subunit 4 n=1 Tax=Arachis hypogaea TaxID=3818 RepID=A0A445C7L4_ARAHY|nr:hypothetical protein Ahy_A07g032764 isoform A [Arachis hypogaea]